MDAWVLIVMITCFLTSLSDVYHRWRRCRNQNRRGYGRRKPALDDAPPIRSRRKPDWVHDAVLALIDELTGAGCRTVADNFNRIHAHTGESVGKTFVNNLQRTRRAETQLNHKALKRRRHEPGTANTVWGLDLTGKTDDAGKTHMILGILDHGTRTNLALRALPSKATVCILRQLLDVIECYGKPRCIRTDNEAIFTSRLFRFCLRTLGIRHQTIDLHSPWQNGRIERFFGTLKRKLDHWVVSDLEGLNVSLAEFRLWYNHIRPHQHLQGKTPAEIWKGIDVFRHPHQHVIKFEAWEGLLTGYHLRR